MRVLLVVAMAALATAPAGDVAALPEGTRVQTYLAGLNFPVDMAWQEGTRRVFFTEKNTGRVRIASGRQVLEEPCVDLDVEPSGERGALGIALHPQFEENHFLYVYWTQKNPLENRVTRWRVDQNQCREPLLIIGGLKAANNYHSGGQLEFMGGMLFVSTGDAHSPAMAQDTSSPMGKVLRLEPDGSIPENNPFSLPGVPNPVWSYGHRNPFGLAHRHGTGQLFETENGPSCDDELNRIIEARNYGWGPNYECGTAGVGTNPKAPLVRWSDIIVPTDPWWYEGRMQSLSGALFVGNYGTGKLRRFELNAQGTRVVDRRVVHDHDSGILDVSKGPRGWLYFLTNDSIERIVPVES